MNSRKLVFALSGSLLLTSAGVVNADATNTEAELAALKARIAQLEGTQSQNWLNERRAEEVKSLVREVLADADTRASLQADGLTAGHNGSNFFLASENGDFLLKVGGQIQVRYVHNFRDDATDAQNDSNNELGGFELRRTKLSFQGHVGSPRIQYAVRLSADRNTESVSTDQIKVGFQVMDGLMMWIGEDKGAFLREELVSSARQLAVERSFYNEVFTLGRVQGIWANWDVSDVIKVTIALHDGANSGEPGDDATKGFNGDDSDLSVGGRVDLKLAGDWNQWNEFSSWDGDDMAIFVGAAADYQIAETGESTPDDNIKVLRFTVDGSVQSGGFNVFASGSGVNVELEDGSHIEHWGAMIQAGYMLIPDKFEVFGRYEWILIDSDVAPDSNELNFVTAGFNYYINRHNAKFTVDAVWALDPIQASNTSGIGVSQTGLGLLLDDEEDNQIAVRAQFQLLF
jgi:hypothetical protein